MGSFWLALVLIIFFGHASVYGGEKLPENTVDTALTWINQVRTRKGFKTLSVDPRLDTVAKKHSEQMAEHSLLSASDPALGTPFERVRSAGLTDTNNLVVVAHAKNWELLKEQLESSENLSKILSPEMTTVGAGIKQDSTGGIWLTIHMSERAITFTRFTISQLSTVPAARSITIKGNTQYKKIKVMLVPPEGSNPDLAVDHVIVPDSNGDFKITLSFGNATGSFSFEFYVQKDGVYELKNSFSMDI